MIPSPLEVAAYAGKLAGIACDALIERLAPVDVPVQLDDFDEPAAGQFLHDEAVRLDVTSSAANGEAPPTCAHPAERPAPPDLPRVGGAGHPTSAVERPQTLAASAEWLHSTDRVSIRFRSNSFRYELTPTEASDLQFQIAQAFKRRALSSPL